MDLRARALKLLGCSAADLERGGRDAVFLAKLKRRAKKAFRKAVKVTHPDVGGDAAVFAAVVALHREVEALTAKVGPSPGPRPSPPRPKSKPPRNPPPSPPRNSDAPDLDDSAEHRIWIMRIQLDDAVAELRDMQHRMHRALRAAAHASDSIVSLQERLDRKGIVLDDLYDRARCAGGAGIDDHNRHACRCRGQDKRVFGT